MSQKKSPSYRFAMRFDSEMDADLIEWLESQPEGKRSQAVRELMRKGLREDELKSELYGLVQNAMAEMLAETHISSKQRSQDTATNDLEEAFGEKLDDMLDRFG